MRASIPVLFFFMPPPTPETYTLSLHDALPISAVQHQQRPRLYGRREVARDRFRPGRGRAPRQVSRCRGHRRSEEHTSELQSRQYLVCRLLLEKKKNRTAQRRSRKQQQDTETSP